MIQANILVHVTYVLCRLGS